MRQAWYLGGGLKPWELNSLSIVDRDDYLNALDWWLEQVGPGGSISGRSPAKEGRE